MSGGSADFATVKTLTGVGVTIQQSEAKAALAALHFIFENAARFSVEASVLQMELEQLGLPSMHCKSVVASYADNLAELRAELTRSGLRMPSLDRVEWRVDCVLDSSDVQEINAPSVQLRLDVSSGRTLAFELSEDMFHTLHQELQTAKGLMTTLG
jgi:hypothetical protein|tara:strand:+ start:186 stop:653 length:468 start_codon:yes stop_codon:yes gene_type:complete